jgi:quercetin dioxygenase-like cupin family protein
VDDVLGTRLSHPTDLGRVLQEAETFRSKSGGSLTVLFQLDTRALERFLSRSRSLRIYRVTQVPRGGTGAREFHKYRSEIITVERGSFRLILEDVRGRKKTTVLGTGKTYGIIPPFVLHTYIAQTDNSSLHVVANRLYDRDRPATHDSYPEIEFRRLQARSRKT